MFVAASAMGGALWLQTPWLPGCCSGLLCVAEEFVDKAFIVLPPPPAVFMVAAIKKISS